MQDQPRIHWLILNYFGNFQSVIVTATVLSFDFDFDARSGSKDGMLINYSLFIYIVLYECMFVCVLI